MKNKTTKRQHFGEIRQNKNKVEERIEFYFEFIKQEIEKLNDEKKLNLYIQHMNKLNQDE